MGNERDDDLKKRWFSWWIVNIFWIVLFVIGAAIIWLRENDGAGVTQTPELRLVALIVLLFAFIIPIIIQVVWLIVNISIKSSSK